MKNSTRSILPALLAVGGGLASTTAAAIELGEVNVHSTIGQPLRASVAYALGPNEQIANYCVSLKPGFASNGLPAVTRANVSIANGVISLTGVAPIREPLMTLRLDVACPYTPKLSREYMLFIDPARPVQAQAPVAVAATVSSAPATQPQRPAQAPTQAPAASRAPIDGSVSYRVQPGDSLSLIAQRIENRSVGLWSAVAQIFTANPDAFINNDPNQLKAGSLLRIPNFGSQATFAETRATSSEAAASASPASDPVASVAQTYDDAFADAVANRPVGEPVSEPVVEPVLEPVVEPVAEDFVDDTRVLQPGDIVLDTELEAPVVASSPNVPTASVITTSDTDKSSVNWLLWLIGGGIALIAGLFVFGRRGRESGVPAPAAAHPLRRATDGNTEKLEAIAEPSYEIEDDSPTQENLVLDANLEIGSGLQDGTDVDVSQDFGFAATTELDLELPDERALADSSQTDIIKPPHIDESSILESEVLPDDDDYDMSVIVDATKMPIPEEVTKRDLKAVVVEPEDGTLISDTYTVSKEVDYDILEQDYEEEMTATQALNLEIERAAAEIAESMDNDDHGDETAQMPLATVTELDVTANLPASNADSLDENDETAVLTDEKTEEILAEENTVEMPANDGKRAG